MLQCYTNHSSNQMGGLGPSATTSQTSDSQHFPRIWFWQIFSRLQSDCLLRLWEWIGCSVRVAFISSCPAGIGRCNQFHKQRDLGRKCTMQDDTTPWDSTFLSPTHPMLAYRLCRAEPARDATRGQPYGLSHPRMALSGIAKFHNF